MNEESNNFLAASYSYTLFKRVGENIKTGPGLGLKHFMSFNKHGIEDGDKVESSAFGFSNSGMSSYFFLPVFGEIEFNNNNSSKAPIIAFSIGYAFSLNSNSIKTYDESQGIYPSYKFKLQSNLFTNLYAGFKISEDKFLLGPYAEFQPTRVKVSNFSDFSNLNIDDVNIYKLANYQVGLKGNYCF